MTVELLQTLSIAAYIAAGVFILIAVALFFLFDVPKLYGNISGRTAKKAIEKIRQKNENTGSNAYQTSVVNTERSKLTDKITLSGRLTPQTAGLPMGIGTEKFSTSALSPQFNETTVLSGNVFQGSSETTLLVNEEYGIKSTVIDGTFSVDVEMSFTGSSEIIE